MWPPSNGATLRPAARRGFIPETTMRKTILTTLAVLAIGGAAAGIMMANAQPAGPPPGADGPGGRPHWMGWQQHDRDGHRGDMMQRLRGFALVYPQADRKLTPPDVQKI